MNIGINYDKIDAVTGFNYVGMMKCELVQQQFSGSNKLIKNNTYQLKMFIRPVIYKTYGYYGSSLSWSNPNFGILTVKLRKSKMRYSIENTICSSSNYCDKLSENSGNTIQILNETITLNIYPNGNWYELNATFKAPSDAESYDWVVIELSDQESNCDTYILIDDVSITMDCDDCSRTSGCMNPSTNDVHWACSAEATNCAPNNYLKFWNLDNVKKAELYIYNVNSALISSSVVKSENGITNPIYWDGKNINGGFEMVPGPYLYELHMWNDCGKAPVFKNSFEKSHFGTGPSSYPPVYEYSDIITPKACCQNDIYVDNITWKARV
ncbi:MAG: hypothetical protein H0V01_10420 [Bacteroidetes bacterium]|nr:hypothetical protein [Bacteroidota bacterium]HET6245072.1 hypothetical protein [Bacteroidia bacterium]